MSHLPFFRRLFSNEGKGPKLRSAIVPTAYGLIETAADAAAKALALDDFTLAAGARVAVQFAEDNAADGVTLDVAETGALPIQYGGQAVDGSILTAGPVYDLICTGTAWEIIGGVSQPTAAQTLSSVIAATPNYYRRAALFEPHQTYITIKADTQVRVGDRGLVSTQDVDLQLSDCLSASARAGVDLYVYACQPEDEKSTEPVFVLSQNSTVPDGYDADSSRKIGGFHCLCSAVGTISDNTLSGYATGDILPDSVWDLRFKPNGDTEGRIYWKPTNSWHTIYGLSWDGSKLRSVYGGTVVTGTSATPMHGEKLNEELAKIGNRLMTRDEFSSGIAKGTPELSAASGGVSPNTTGGNVNQNGQRIISSVGCEDCCGVWWWWTADIECAFNMEGSASTYQYGGVNTNESNYYLDGYHWESTDDAKTGHESIDGTRDKYGRSYGGVKRNLAGAYWNNNGACGSRSVDGRHLSAIVDSSFAGRGASEPGDVSDV